MTQLEFKNQYLDHASVEEMHHLLREWQSQVEFWNAESVFFYKLVDKYFLKSAEADQGEHFEALLKRINAFVDQTLPGIREKIEEQKSKLSALVENKFAQNEQQIRDRQRKLDRRMREVQSHFQILKQEIFESVEEVKA